MSAEGPDAGWYEDPDNHAKERYWDGRAWTDHRRDKQGSAYGSRPSADEDAWTLARRLNLAVAGASEAMASDNYELALELYVKSLHATRKLYALPNRPSGLTSQLRGIASTVFAEDSTTAERLKRGIRHITTSITKYGRENLALLEIMGGSAGAMLGICLGDDPRLLTLEGVQQELLHASVILVWAQSNEAVLPDISETTLAHYLSSIPSTSPDMEPVLIEAIFRAAEYFSWSQPLRVMQGWGLGTQETSAGWHPDPHRRAHRRYWNGESWTGWVADSDGNMWDESAST